MGQKLPLFSTANFHSVFRTRVKVLYFFPKVSCGGSRHLVWETFVKILTKIVFESNSFPSVYKKSPFFPYFILIVLILFCLFFSKSEKAAICELGNYEDLYKKR
ncbi:hypothetical protein LEP1GSC173_1410 [Leptospira interrogans str. HAI1594]|uniref:Uncharacterized protein n=1 Tax=Leptospira interrogans serogroup Icterohaemorrhagiae serovar copenhageni (strain Fiocruz L1-130) TaxID=267671 RepID=Q72S53_LEPIC|nr:hypothetical protein LIC_11533 [Leptospira interrogans serovar Copenhageni str. Fiocruz L1-130]EKP75613.1 hypothetical protein LEP1GSC173_1410 [Leptospira interrogans str. HAI1594]